VSGIGMEISLIGKIRTPFGEVGLIPQDRNLLEASSLAPLQFADVRIHLWSMLEPGENPHPAFTLLPLIKMV
jgi:hypothetical protein